ncbi:hypothetical protein [Actinophytocola sp. NPDC049390]|uniref:hypothetical protein n=1 Tax=Actinophytocola sp. NPDC049390 TaxID=3363894 RepID=UPI0037ABD9D1
MLHDAISRPAISRPAISRPAISRPAISRPAISRPAISRPAIPRPATGAARHATMVAAEAVLLWPRDAGALSAVADEPRWPVVAVVVAEPRTGDPDTAALFALLDGQSGHSFVSVLDGLCWWSVRDESRSLLALTVQLTSPIRCDVDVVLPLRPLSDVVDVMTAGATIALTSPTRAARLNAPIDVRTALAEVVLVNCRPSADLGRAATVLRGQERPAKDGS